MKTEMVTSPQLHTHTWGKRNETSSCSSYDWLNVRAWINANAASPRQRLRPAFLPPWGGRFVFWGWRSQDVFYNMIHIFMLLARACRSGWGWGIAWGWQGWGGWGSGRAGGRRFLELTWRRYLVMAFFKDVAKRLCLRP